ncbi:hypothetical protein [Oceanobacillus sp. J11TS1]|uniref:hypothetical protein n=1 Tax=Oceanobacillus sp. J11TS1 TaxID=2807191 RepID=UPI001B112994|nr:hypothetical protein [Oceanobacillus sp. J11TS1]GIO22490.1 hypothetical protein J11TS1_10710 [Oceanobacillus sp. J11TS1]
MNVTVNSFIKPIHASIDEKDFPQHVIIEVESRVSSIESNTDRHVGVFRSSESIHRLSIQTLL